VVGLLISIAIISSVFRQPVDKERGSVTPLTSQPLAEKVAPDSNLDTTPAEPKQSQPVSNSPASSVPAAVDQKVSDKMTEPVYYCGAATKKGTPCSRRVKRPGERCWQHTGMPSMAVISSTSQK